MNWEKIFKEIGNIQLYKNGDCIVIWYGNTHQTYWDYTITEAKKLFIQKTGIKGKVERTNFCPFILN